MKVVLDRNFLSSSKDTLSLNDYRRIRKVCDDAHYYAMHHSDYKLLLNGSLLMQKKIWPNIKITRCNFFRGEKELYDSSIILRYEKDLVQDHFNFSFYDGTSLRFMKVFSDMAFYANDPNEKNERLTLLNEVRNGILRGKVALSVYDFVDIPLEQLNNNERFLYHPFMYTSSSLYRLSELNLQENLEGTGYYIPLGVPLRSQVLSVNDSLREFGSFKLPFKVNFAEPGNEKSVSLESNSKLFENGHFYPARNRDYRAVLNHIAISVFNNAEMNKSMLARESEFLEYMIGKNYSKDLYLPTTDGRTIVDPAISKKKEGLVSQLPVCLSDFYIARMTDEQKQRGAFVMENLESGIATGRLVRSDKNDKFQLTRHQCDAITVFNKYPLLYEMFKDRKQVWDHTHESYLNKYNNIDQEAVKNKDYKRIESEGEFSLKQKKPPVVDGITRVVHPDGSVSGTITPEKAQEMKQILINVLNNNFDPDSDPPCDENTKDNGPEL